MRALDLKGLLHELLHLRADVAQGAQLLVRRPLHPGRGAVVHAAWQ